MLEDLATALSADHHRLPTSRLYFILRPEDAAQLATTPGIVGPAFMQLASTAAAFPASLSSSPTRFADGTALLVDASQLLTASTPLKSGRF